MRNLKASFLSLEPPLSGMVRGVRWSHHLGLSGTATKVTPKKNFDSKVLWWDLPPAPLTQLNRARRPLPSLEVLRGVRLSLTLSRRGRQAVAEMSLTTAGPDTEVTAPLTLFTGSWVAHLLGYSRKYRGTRFIEAFMGSALRSYLLLYSFVPLYLSLKGAFFNFNFLWRAVNRPSNQIFAHPITMEILWDVRMPTSANSSMDTVKEAMAASLGEFGRGGLIALDDEMLAYEAKVLKGLPPHHSRYHLTWDQVLFFPTRIKRPRRPKKARSIRKRLAKRIVRTAGRRFWAS